MSRARSALAMLAALTGVGAAPVQESATLFRSTDQKAKLDLARLRALIVRLEGQPGGKTWLELKNVRFYR